MAGEPINPEFLFNFPAQDVTADYYTFRKSKTSSGTTMLASTEGPGGEKTQEVANSTTRSSHFYKVQRGETLYSIARKLGLSVSKLASTNSLKTSSRLRTGQILRY